MIFSDYKPAHTKGTFLASLENVPFVAGSGASPPTPPKMAQQKNQRFSSYAVIV